ncbi:MAG: hypothetical protein NUV35_08315, partial [Syntrophomonadaceae bacterium]|nr:hypothetical protein [Syntrophomonadaceae bacterium]
GFWSLAHQKPVALLCRDVMRAGACFAPGHTNHWAWRGVGAFVEGCGILQQHCRTSVTGGLPPFGTLGMSPEAST